MDAFTASFSSFGRQRLFTPSHIPQAASNANSNLNLKPLHEQPFPSIDPQSSSPLYNGLIPAEIRTTIFDYALTEYHKPEEKPTFIRQHPNTKYPKDTHYTRPGYTGKKTINVALLQICRRTYLETYHLPPTKKEHVFWHARGPQNHPGSTLAHYGEQEIRYFARLPLWQRVLIKDIHLFTQSFWLEKIFPEMVKRDFMQGIERVKITIRRGDWWWNESNHLLGISPQSGSGDAQHMLKQWAIERAGGSIPWSEKGWGYAFTHLPNLKELKMELETSDDKRDELKAIVQHAKNWKFPAHSKDGGVDMILSADGFEPQWSSWDGPNCYWSDICPYCGQAKQCRVVDPPNKGCVDRMERLKNHMGPLCHVAALTWKLSRKFDRA